MNIKMTIKTTPDPSTTHRSDDELRALADAALPGILRRLVAG